MVTSHGDVLRTDAIETSSNGGTLPVAATDVMDLDASAAWNAWWDQRFAVENENWCQSMGGVVATVRREYEEPLAAMAQRIKQLELQVAEAVGALNVLRTIGGGSINHRGAYDPGASYARGDACMLDGSSFLATRDHAGPCPGPDWRLLASAGRRGQRGVRGPRGEPVKVKWATFDSSRMAVSIVMSDGTSTTIPLAAVFRGVTIDRESYCIVVRMSDNSELRFSVRELFQQYDDEKRQR